MKIYTVVFMEQIKRDLGVLHSYKKKKDAEEEVEDLNENGYKGRSYYYIENQLFD